MFWLNFVDERPIKLVAVDQVSMNTAYWVEVFWLASSFPSHRRNMGTKTHFPNQVHLISTEFFICSCHLRHSSIGRLCRVGGGIKRTKELGTLIADWPIHHRGIDDLRRARRPCFICFHFLFGATRRIPWRSNLLPAVTSPGPSPTDSLRRRRDADGSAWSRDRHRIGSFRTSPNPTQPNPDVSPLEPSNLNPT